MGIKTSGAIETLSREISGRYAACHGRVRFLHFASVEMTIGRGSVSAIRPFEMTYAACRHRHLERRGTAVWGKRPRGLLKR